MASILYYLKTVNGEYLPIYDAYDFPFGNDISLICGTNHNFWENYPNFDYTIRFDLINGNYMTLSLKVEGEHAASGGIKLYFEDGTLAGDLTVSNTAVNAPYKDFLVALAYDSLNDVLSAPNVAASDLYGGAVVTQPGIFPAAIGRLNNGNPSLPSIGNVFETWSEGSIVDVPPVNPYEPGGESDAGGGTGSFDDTSDPVPVPSLPSLSAVDTGFITLFNPSLSEIRALASYMWSTGFDLDTFKKLFANPMDVIMGLSIVPVTIPSGGSRTVNVGNISTGVTMNVAGRQYIEKDCGTLTIDEYWGSYLDYSPYTKVEIYLPFIGTKTLDIDDVAGKAVNVTYHIDILSGACVAFVKSDDHVVYSFSGQCAAQVPVTSADMNNLISGAIGAAAAIGGALVTGGAAIPVVAAAASTARAVVSAKPNIDRSGDMSGYSGLLGIQTPYLIFSRPNQCVPREMNHYMGYPSFITKYLNDVSGYTEIESIHLAVPGASGPEMDEIEGLLKEGVIL